VVYGAVEMPKLSAASECVFPSERFGILKDCSGPAHSGAL
jgi:hypothetical protein